MEIFRCMLYKSFFFSLFLSISTVRKLQSWLFSPNHVYNNTFRSPVSPSFLKFPCCKTVSFIFLLNVFLAMKIFVLISTLLSSGKIAPLSVFFLKCKFLNLLHFSVNWHDNHFLTVINFHNFFNILENQPCDRIQPTKAMLRKWELLPTWQRYFLYVIYKDEYGNCLSVNDYYVNASLEAKPVQIYRGGIQDNSAKLLSPTALIFSLKKKFFVWAH